jgi:nucleotide-binding universal stress UspA family protein
MTGKKKGPVTHKVLIAIDGSAASLNAVRYAAAMLGLIPDLNFMLLFVMPAVPPYLLEGVTDGAKLAKIGQFEQAGHALGEKVLLRGRERLLDLKVPNERIEVKNLRRLTVRARDILAEAEKGRYDALLVGRRGLTRAQEIFMGSVTHQLVQHATDVPLWIIDGRVTAPQVMVAVDGSENSLRAVDQVAFMLGSNPMAKVHFLHVVPKLQNVCPIDIELAVAELAVGQGDLEAIEEEFQRQSLTSVDDFTGRATQILREAGFSPDRISTEVREVTLGIARTILKAAEEGGYGTIVLGRRGMSRSPFLGSVSDRVIRRARGRAIWLVV